LKVDEGAHLHPETTKHKEKRKKKRELGFLPTHSSKQQKKEEKGAYL
jgi:hypothetical protein